MLQDGCTYCERFVTGNTMNINVSWNMKVYNLNTYEGCPSTFEIRATTFPTTLVCACNISFYVRFYVVRGSAVGWGTALQAGRPRLPFPLVSLRFFADFVLSPHYGPGIDSASNRIEYQRSSLGGKGGRCLQLATLLLLYDNWKSWKPETSGDFEDYLGL
jgi:hypothetical protein